ncbi:MAG: DUF1918 domain-containing protein [Acidimicrobiia bacterium]|nr:DUF1918 domain-containing protein [Acidimicrobiia bacterium]
MDIKAERGDVLVVEPSRSEPRRRGEVLEVVGDGEALHYRVRWEDGHESLFYPSSTAHVVPAREGN